MSTAAATAAWKSYKTGVEINGWKIVEIVRKTTAKGYRTRVFTLECLDTGRRVRKSSRGITLFAEGQPIDYVEPVAVEVTPVVDVKPEPVAVVPGKVRHANYEALLRAVRAKVAVWLYGPPGTGKTTAAANVAEDLGLDFYPVPCGPQTSEAKLLGYTDAVSKVVLTQLRKAYEFGGVALLDEIDAASPATLVTINSLLGNDQVGFPDGTVRRHPNFVPICGANTVGQGGNRLLVGRNQLDGATLDRFCILSWETDPGIAAAAAGLPAWALEGLPQPKTVRFEAEVSADQVSERCIAFAQYTVKVVNALASFNGSVRAYVGNRAFINGTALIRQGFSVADALEACVWKGLDGDTRAKIEACL